MRRYSPLFGDLSSNNAGFDARVYRETGHIIVAIKATEGTHYVNPDHRSWCLHAGLEHVAVVHYHFARPDLGNSPEAEAAHFLDVALPLTGGRDYLVLDLERGTPQGWQHDPGWSVAFDEHVQARSRFHTILYASASTLRTSDSWLAGDKKRVWDADWSTDRDYAPPGYRCVFRQFTDGVFGPGPHDLPGIGRGDVNVMSPAMLETVSAHAR